MANKMHNLLGSLRQWRAHRASHATAANFNGDVFISDDRTVKVVTYRDSADIRITGDGLGSKLHVIHVNRDRITVDDVSLYIHPKLVSDFSDTVH